MDLVDGLGVVVVTRIPVVLAQVDNVEDHEADARTSLLLIHEGLEGVEVTVDMLEVFALLVNALAHSDEELAQAFEGILIIRLVQQTTQTVVNDLLGEQYKLKQLPDEPVWYGGGAAWLVVACLGGKK